MAAPNADLTVFAPNDRATVVTSLLFYYIANSQIEQERNLRKQLTKELNSLYEAQVALKQQLLAVNANVSKPEIVDIRTQQKNMNSISRTTKQKDDAMTTQSILLRLIEEKRTARAAEASSRQWEILRSSNMENRDGPYGDFNVKVNTISKKLNLDDNQASYYHALLVDYEEQADALYEGIRFTGLSSVFDFDHFQILLEEVELEKQALDTTFDQEFVQLLTTEQARLYELIPPEERGVGPNAGMDRMEFTISDLSALARE